jgi:hypothetical protein
MVGSAHPTQNILNVGCVVPQDNASLPTPKTQKRRRSLERRLFDPNQPITLQKVNDKRIAERLIRIAQRLEHRQHRHNRHPELTNPSGQSTKQT